MKAVEIDADPVNSDWIKQKRRQIGVLVDNKLWTEIKILALQQGRTAGELLEDALRLYLESNKESKK